MERDLKKRDHGDVALRVLTVGELPARAVTDFSRGAAPKPSRYAIRAIRVGLDPFIVTIVSLRRTAGGETGEQDGDHDSHDPP